jgi:BASS family bile acid:Na+ symporter
MLRFFQAAVTKLLPLWIVCCALLAYHFPGHFLFLKNWTAPALAFILFNMGLTLSQESLRRVIRQPKNALLGVAGKWTISLGISIGLAFLFFRDQPDLLAGTILAGAVPSGTSANLYTFMAGGTLALSIMMSAVDTLVGPVLTPLIMKATVGSVVPVAFLPLFLQMVYVVLLPILAGLAIQWKWESRLAPVKKVIPLLSAAALIVVDLAVVSGAQTMLQENLVLLPWLFLCVFLQITVPMVLGYCFGAGFRMPEADRRSVVYEFGICNTALAALLAMEHISPIAAVPAVANMITNTSLAPAGSDTDRAQALRHNISQRSKAPFVCETREPFFVCLGFCKPAFSLACTAVPLGRHASRSLPGLGEVNCLPHDAHRGFLDAFRDRRMGMDRFDQLVERSLERQTERRFRNHFGRVRSQQMNAEKPPVLSVRYHL